MQIFTSTTYSQTPSVCSSLNARDQVSNPYKTIGNQPTPHTQEQNVQYSYNKDTDTAMCTSFILSRPELGFQYPHLPAWAGGCRLSYQSKSPSYRRSGREGEWATWEITREEREGSVKMGEDVAESRPENEGDTFLRNVGSHKIYTAPHPRRRHSS
jgi:hypothetical protein